MSDREKKIKVGNSLEELLGGSSEELRALERDLERKKKQLPNQEVLFEQKRQAIETVLRSGDPSHILRFMLNQEPSLADIGAELDIAISVLNFVKEKLIESFEDFIEFFDYLLPYFSKIINYYKTDYEKKRFYEIFQVYLMDIYREMSQSNYYSSDELQIFLDFIDRISPDILSVKIRLEVYSNLSKQISMFVLKELDIESLTVSLDFFLQKDRVRYGLNIINSLMDSIESTYMEFITDEDKMSFFQDLLSVISEKIRGLSIKEEYFIPFKLKLREILITWINKKDKIKISQELFVNTLENSKELLGEENARKLIEDFNIFTKREIKFIR